MENVKTKIRKTNVTYKDLYEAIETIVLSSYGINNLTNRFIFASTKHKNDLKDCIVINKNIKNEYRFKIYVTLNSYIKITEIINEIQKRINYELTKLFKIKILSVDIYVQNII